jgi:hypothetical protein
MGFRFVFGGTTLHVIALSYKDKAVISWTPSSYLNSVPPIWYTVVNGICN